MARSGISQVINQSQWTSCCLLSLQIKVNRWQHPMAYGQGVRQAGETVPLGWLVQQCESNDDYVQVIQRKLGRHSNWPLLTGTIPDFTDFLCMTMMLRRRRRRRRRVLFWLQIWLHLELLSYVEQFCNIIKIKKRFLPLLSWNKPF